jgi:NAD-dependent SIR2 family protein deacetylase
MTQRKIYSEWVVAGEKADVGKTTESGVGKKRGATGKAECYCPKCGERFTHQRDIPCFINKCPKCGALLIRA